MIQFIKELFNDKYEVTIWYNNPDGTRTGESQVFELSHLKKINQNEMIGNDMNGKRVTVKTLNKFDYFVKKIY